MGEPGNRAMKRTHSLFVDNLKVYQESHQALKIVNEIIVQASHDTGACYGVSKCAEIIFKNGKMVKGEGLQVLEERMKTMDPDENEIYKFLGIEQADGIRTKAVYERVKEEVAKRMKMIVKTELNDENLIKAINIKVIPVAAYVMNICKFNVSELIEAEREYKATWRKVKISLQKATEAKRIEIYKTKVQQSQFYQKQEEECHLWLKQNLQGRKTSSIMTMLEQMV